MKGCTQEQAMMDRITLNLQPRDIVGKKVRSLRRAGIVPIHFYGSGIASRTLQCQVRELIEVLTKAGRNTAVSITIEGEKDEHLAFVREIQWDPVKGHLFHVDFLRAEVTQRVSAEVPVTLTGDSPGAREISGTIVQQLRSLTVEALPLEMPQQIIVDLSSLTRPDSIIRAGDISLPPSAEMITDSDEVVVRIEAPRVEVVGEMAPAAEAEEQQEEQ